MVFSRAETFQNLIHFETICVFVVVILGSGLAPPWPGSMGLSCCTLKCRAQRITLSKRRSKLASQRFVQKLTQSVWFFSDSKRPKILPLFVAERSYSRGFRTKIPASLVRIGGSLFSHPKMPGTDGEFVQKGVKTGPRRFVEKLMQSV